MTQEKTLIRGATVVFPDGPQQANILVEGSKIHAVDAAWDQPADEVIEADGLHLLPGVVDDQVHFRDPGLTHKEDIETGSMACAAGGVTTFLEMPNTSPPAICRQTWQQKYERASKVSYVNYGFYIGATEDNVSELNAVENCPGIKIFIGSSTGSLLVDDQTALERIFAETSLPICAHCEDESTVQQNRQRLLSSGRELTVSDHSRIRDHAAALISVRRSVDLALRHQHRFHVLHVSTAGELPEVVKGRPFVTGEACPHHLFFNTKDYDRLGSLVQMNPSIKEPEDNDALWQALLTGDLQVIATDHAPHTLQEKQLPYPESPSGLPAVENSLALMLNQVAQGKCSLQQVVAWMCDAPARVWGLVGKGRIEPGYDADLVLVDLQAKRTIENSKQFTRARWSPWDGQSLTGWPVTTLVRGVTVYRDGQPIKTTAAQPVICDHQRGGFWSTLEGVGV